MDSVRKRRYLYETFFDCNPIWSEHRHYDRGLDSIEYVVNHPIFRRIEADLYNSTSCFHVQTQPATDQIKLASIQSSPSISPVSSISSPRTVYSSRETCENRLSQSHSPLLMLHSASVHHPKLSSGHLKFSLNLSPKLRSKFCEMLSPISDKSQEISEHDPINSMKPTVPKIATHERKIRPKSLFSQPKDGTGLNSSDSGISVSAHSLVSHDALPISSKTAHLSLDNSQETLSVEGESLPFLMPKLNRTKLPSSSPVSRPFQSSAGLSLTLPFPSKTVCQFQTNQQDVIDGDIPLHLQSWYHGSITRRDAETRLRVTPEGSFLVRDSLATSYDYFLAARGQNGFLHVQITSPDDFDMTSRTYQLASLPGKNFESVAAIVNHCAKIGIYSQNHPPIVLKYPLPDDSF